MTPHAKEAVFASDLSLFSQYLVPEQVGAAAASKNEKPQSVRNKYAAIAFLVS